MSVIIAICILFGAAVGIEEKDIYDVITGEKSETIGSIDPVFHVGIHEDKPKKLPNSHYDLEIMTSSIGKRFVCMIPKGIMLFNPTKIKQNKTHFAHSQ